MDNQRLIKLATMAGQIILESGGEIYRVEETIRMILQSYNTNDAESFVTPTGIMVSLTEDNGNIVSLIRRVQKSNIDLEKVSLVNSLSRELMEKPLSLDVLEERLFEISEKRPYSIPFQLIMAAMCGFSFTILFGGTFIDALIALVIGICVRLLQLGTREIKLNGIFINIIGGALVALLVHFFTRTLSISPSSDIITIGSIMLLVPGIAFTNAIRDILMGDYLSGVSKGMEAFLIAVGIAIGAGTVLALLGGV